MRLKSPTHYYIVDFRHGKVKTTIEIEDCTTQEIIDFIHKNLKQYTIKPANDNYETVVTARLVKSDGSKVVYHTNMYRKTPNQLRSMLQSLIS